MKSKITDFTVIQEEEKIVTTFSQLIQIFCSIGRSCTVMPHSLQQIIFGALKTLISNVDNNKMEDVIQILHLRITPSI